MSLCNECLPGGFCRALRNINQDGVVAQRINNARLTQIEAGGISEKEVAELEAKIELTELSHQRTVESERTKAVARLYPNLEDFP
jgi:hypothetical protein